MASGRTRTEFTDIDDRYEMSFRRSSAAFVDGLLSDAAIDLSPDMALKALQVAFAVYQSSNEHCPVDPSTIEGAVSPPWWPKSPEELIDDVVALGLMPEGLDVDDAAPFMRTSGSEGDG
jgi:hypothetical protein